MPIRNRQQLIDSGLNRFLFFWGHTPARPGQVDASCFSQWFDAPFLVGETEYPTAEHYMMAEKARLFGDHASHQAILASPHPHQAKSLGRQVQGFVQELWEQACWDIVVRANLEKFSQNPELQAFLLGTGSRVLVEASPQDRIWGIGLSRDDPRASDPRLWLGENRLGFALMEVRERLSSGMGYVDSQE